MIRVVVWGKQTEACWQSLTVGSAVLIEGYLRLDVRTNREGQRERRMEVLAERVNFLDARGAIRAAVPREPPIDAASGFEVDSAAEILEADPPALEE